MINQNNAPLDFDPNANYLREVQAELGGGSHVEGRGDSAAVGDASVIESLTLESVAAANAGTSHTPEAMAEIAALERGLRGGLSTGSTVESAESSEGLPAEVAAAMEWLKRNGAYKEKFSQLTAGEIPDKEFIVQMIHTIRSAPKEMLIKEGDGFRSVRYDTVEGEKALEEYLKQGENGEKSIQEQERKKFGTRMYEVLKSGRFAYGDKVRIDGSVEGLLIYDADEYETRMDAVRHKYEELQKTISIAEREVAEFMAHMSMSKLGSTPDFNYRFAEQIANNLVSKGVVEKFDEHGGGGQMISKMTDGIARSLDRAQRENSDNADLADWIKRDVAFPLTESFRAQNNLGISFNTRDSVALGNSIKENLFEELKKTLDTDSTDYLFELLLEDRSTVKNGQPVTLERLEKYITTT